MFKIGDRVKYVGRNPGCITPRLLGEIGTVIGVHEGLAPIAVLYDNGFRSGGHYLDNIELINDTPFNRSVRAYIQKELGLS